MVVPSVRFRCADPSRTTVVALLVAATLSCGDASAPPVPAAVSVDSGDGQAASVATTLPAPLTVRVTDADGRAVPGVVVTWSTAGDGAALSPASAETTGDGRASATWTLGTTAGSVTASATVAGLPPATFRASALSGDPEHVRALAGEGQRAEVGELLPDPLRVRVEDAWGNPVAGAEVEWTVRSGVLTEAAQETDGDGVAEARWRMGREAGVARATVRAPTGPGGTPVDVEFEATADPATLNLSVAMAYLVQSVQRRTGDVALVAGRSAFLRVFVEANRPTSQRPDVRVELRDAGGTLLAEETVEPPSGFTPGPGSSEATAAASYNLTVPGDRIRPGIRLAVTVDPDDRVVETDEGDNGVADGTGEMTPVVRTAPPFRVTFVPVRINGAVGSIDSPELMLWDTERMFPLNEVAGEVRADTLDLGEYTVLDADDFPQIVGSVLAARVAEGSDATWYGVLPFVDGAVFGGWGLVGGPAAVGVEGASTLAAHEFGHTWGRLHPPCGTAGGVDGNFPYPEAATGVYGFDLANSFVLPPDRTDIMSYTYCGDRHWVSDYTYEGVMEFRGDVAAATTAPAAHARPSLIVWGRVEGDSLVLESAFRAVVPPSLPDEPGPYRLEGFDGSGARLFDLSFRPTPVADAARGAAVFAFAVPLDAAAQVVSMRFGDGLRSVERRAPSPADSPEFGVEPIGGDRVRLRWDSRRHPLVVVRDAVGGAVVAFARGGEAIVHVPVGRALEWVPSDGVDSRVVEPVRR